MSIALVLRWHLYNHFNLDNLNILALWPKWMGQGTGAVHVKSSPLFCFKNFFVKIYDNGDQILIVTKYILCHTYMFEFEIFMMLCF